MKRFLCVLGLAAVLGGCGIESEPTLLERAEHPDLSDKKTFDKIVAKAISIYKVQLRGETYHLPNTEAGYSGWIKQSQGSNQGYIVFLFRVKDGKKDGVYQRWYVNGQKEKEGTYKDGKMEGLWTEWHENGQKRRKWNFKDGKPHGVYRAWNEDGKLSFEATNKNGELISNKKY